MVSATVAHNILAILGNLITFALFFSPLPDFYKIIITKSVEGFHPHPYLANLLISMLWVFYRMPFIHPDHILVVPVNVTGFLLQLVYLAIFFYFADNKPRKKLGIWVVMELMFMAIIVAITMLLLQQTKTRSLMMGVICNTFNMGIYISSLTGVMEMIRTKSVKHMSLAVSFTSFLNACVWTAYAILKHDIYMLINNGVGVISGLLQVITYGYYCVNWSKNIPVEGADTVY
ncbi:bidirectional sugar transporter SWEET7b-like [Cucurbita pepo subsp. pepo]|uniref:bidirectional sugar transporter SWEET7b-like n=1 Tax=Cucurbita pepo subsp. pepo TaxID=3664 RepID=UPI000C9D3649|nr:bidirectional sugar transporter SWEET7b-like [Cucurbita pepo subsp. pepo]